MKKYCNFASQLKMVDVAQQVRASDCGSEGRGFESHLPPQKKEKVTEWWPFFVGD